jgi:hypothetical protein
MAAHQHITALGPAIAQGILNDWPADEQLQAQIATALEDSSARPAIEALGAQIAADHLTPLLADAPLAAPERAPVALAAATALARAVLPAGMPEPQQVSAQLQAAHPDAAQTLSAAGAELYHRLLNTASHEIAEAAREISSFQVGNVSGRNIAIGHRARVTVHQHYTAPPEQVLEAVRRILARPDPAIERFEETYRRAMESELNRLELFGLPRMDRLSRRQSLSMAYVTLSVERRSGGNVVSEPDEAADLPESLLAREFAGLSRREEALALPRSGPVDQVLAQGRRFVVRGEAGSGKSTLLQWLAVRSAEGSFPPALAAWNKTQPFFIRLREHVRKDFPTPEQFPALVARQVAGSTPPGWVHKQLETGRALVLVDGVDELPGDQRGAMLKQLDQLVSAYPLARYVVTSRFAALKDWPAWQEWTEKQEFVELSLQPMDIAAIEQFIEQWHDALSEALPERERAELKPLPASLIRLLRQRPPLRRLAANPLLCAMICALHHDRRQNLPADRIKLYDECVDMLLNRRDLGRGVPRDPDRYPEMGERQKLALAQDFAYWLMRNSYSDVSVAEADAHLAEHLVLMSLPPDTTGTQVRHYFVERTGLLREPVVERVNFAHRTFQEYLAAQQAIKDNDIGLLVKNALDDQWRELIILAAGLARPNECERLLKGLLQRGNKIKRRRKQVHLLAVACLETALELSPQTREEVLNTARPIFPPRDEADAKLVAAGGDPAVELLQYDPAYSAEEAAACVQALALIGSDRAMEAIAGYAGDGRFEVTNAVGDAWEEFDRVQYAQRVLKHTDILRVLKLTSWQGFEHLSHLKLLYIKDASEISDLTPLTSLPNLTELALVETPVSDLTPLASLPNLTGLVLLNTPVSDLTPLASLPNLTKLVLVETPVSDLTPLAKLPNLKEVYTYDEDLARQWREIKARRAAPPAPPDEAAGSGDRTGT